MERKQVEDIVVLAAGKIDYLKEDVDFSDELFLCVAKEYYRKYGYMPDAWVQYIEDRLMQCSK